MKRFLIALLLCLCLGCVGVFAGCDPSPNQVVQPSNPGGSNDNDNGNNGSIESPDNTENKGDSTDTTPSESDKDKTEDNTPSEEEKDDDKQEEVPGDNETDNDNEGKTNPSESEETDPSVDENNPAGGDTDNIEETNPSDEEKSDGSDAEIDDKSEENPDDKEEPNPPIEYVFDEAIQDQLVVMFSDIDFYLGLINLTSVDCTKCSDRLVVTIVVDEPDGAVEQIELLFEMLPDINPEFGELYPDLNFDIEGVDNTVVITVTEK